MFNVLNGKKKVEGLNNVPVKVGHDNAKIQSSSKARESSKQRLNNPRRDLRGEVLSQ